MATLIQSKQIEGIVTASVIEGQFSVSGSIIATGSQSIFSEITASAISSSGPIYGVRYDDIDGTPNFIAGSGIVITQVGDNITITNTGGGGGGISGSAELISSVAQLNAYTGSNDIIILGLNQFTASIQSQVDSLIASTSSYETTGRGIISGSSQLYTDLDSRYALSGSVGGGSTDISSLNTFTSSIQTQVDALSAATSSYITEIPQGTISGSSQVTLSDVDGFTSYSSSVQTTIDNIVHTSIPSGTISGSQQISDLGFVTSSSTSIPAGTISGSAQITALGFTSGSHTDIPSGVISGSTFTDFSSSVATDISNLESTLTTRVDGVEQVVVSRLDNIETFTSSIDTRVTALEGATDLTGSDTQTLSISGDQLTISSGNTITIPTGSSSSIPAGTISGSAQITALGFTSGSHTTLPSGVISGSTQITNIITDSYISESAARSGFGSGGGGSTDITLLNSFTSSYYIDSASFDSRIGDIIETGSVIAPFAFARVATTSNGSGTDISWANWNFINGTLDFTFSTPQPDTNYIVVTDAELNDDGRLVSIQNKTVNGFEASFYTTSGVTTPSSVNPFTIMVYGSNPTQTVRVNVTGAPAGTISGSSQVDITQTSGYTTFSSSIQSTIDAIQHTQIPSGTVSGSTQITDIITDEYISSSAAASGFGSGGTTDISALNSFTSSADTRITNLENFSSSLDSTFATDSELSSLSSSIATAIDNIQHTQIPSGVISGSTFTDFSSSVETRLSTLEGQTDNTGSDTQTISIVGDQLTISGGNTVTIPTGSGEPTDISALNTFTSSIQSQVDSLTSATSSYLTELPSGLVSGSVLTTLDGTGVLSGSILPGTNITIDSSSGDYVISSTASGGSGSGDVSFDGDRVISNTLLGDLYTDGFNAGTTGSIQDFLTAVFFPSYAPTATFITQTSNLNTNLGTENGVIETFTLTDEDSNTPYSATISGTNASSFKLVPKNSNSSSWEIQAATDLSAGSYTYDITVTDSNNDTRTYSGRSVTIAQSDNGTLSTTGTLYIIESATTGPIYLGTNGRGGSQGGVSVSYSPNYGSQVATNFQSSNPLISVNSSTGLLSVGSAISGSGNVSGDTITSTISWTDQYGNTDSSDININVTQNNAPDITFTNSSRLNTNQAVSGGGTLVTISFNDTESDSINYDSFVFTDTSGQLTTTKSGGNYLVTANSNLSGSTTYSISATIEDVHGFRSNTESHSFTITQGGIGTLTGDTTMYIIESAVSGDSFRDATGFGNGNVADVNVTYSPSAGSQTVQSFNSTNPAIQIDSNGNMTLGVNLSGSVTQSGDTISTTITFQDQYGNIGSGSVTANIFGNNAPSVSFVSASSYDTDTAINGSTAGTITISDTESNSPYIVTLGGTDGTKFNAVPQNAASSSWLVQPTASISTSNTYSIDISVTDNYGESTSLTNKSIVVDEVALGGTVYVYTLPQISTGTTYNIATGITADGSGTPPEPTIATNYGFFNEIVNSDTLGDSSITISAFSVSATLRGSASGNNVDTVLDDLGALTIGGSPASERIFVFIPSGSEMSGVPTSLSTADPGASSTSGEYVLFVSPDGTFQNSSAGLSNDIKEGNIHKLTLGTAVDGYTDWIVIGTEDRFNNANAYVRIVPSSGSVPS